MSPPLIIYLEINSALHNKTSRVELTILIVAILQLIFYVVYFSRVSIEDALSPRLKIIFSFNNINRRIFSVLVVEARKRRQN